MTEEETYKLNFETGDSLLKLQSIEKVLEKIQKGPGAAGIAKIGKAFKSLQKPLKAVDAAIKRNQKNIENAGKTLKASFGTADFKNAESAVSKSAVKFRQLGTAVSGSAKQFDKLSTSLRNTDSFKGVESNASKAIRSIKKMEMAATRAKKAIAATDKKSRRLTSPSKQFENVKGTAQFKQLGVAMAGANAQHTKLSASLKKASGIKSVNTHLGRTKVALNTFNRESLKSGRSVAQAFGQNATRGVRSVEMATSRANKALTATDKKTRKIVASSRRLASVSGSRPSQRLKRPAAFKADRNIEQTAKSLKSLEAASTRATSKLRRLLTVLKKIESIDIVTKLKGIDRTLDSIDKKATDAGKSIKRAMGKATARSVANMSHAIGSASRKLDEASRKANKARFSFLAFSEASKNVGRGLSTVNQGLNRYLLAPMAAVGVGSIKAAFDINKSMANVSTMLSGPPEQVIRLKKEIQGMAIESGKSTSELAGGLYDVISALGETEDNMSQLAIATKASIAGNTDVSSSIKMLSLVGKAYNDVSLESLTRISDLAFKTVELGQTTFPELAASMGKVTPLAAALNISQEQLFGTMATLTGVTGNTSEVTTQLSAVMSAILQPSEKMEEALVNINDSNSEYNFKTVSAMVKTLDWKKSLELLGKAVGNDSDKLAEMLGTKEALLAVLPLLGTQSDAFSEKTGKMTDVTGASTRAHEKQTEGINKQGHEWEKTKQRMIVFAQNLGQRLLPIMDKVMDTLEPVIEYLENMDEAAIDNAISIAGLALKLTLVFKALSTINKVAGAVSGLIGGMGTAAVSATPGIRTLGATIKSLTGYIGLAIMAYEALSAAYTAWEEHGEGKQKKREAKAQASTDVVNQMRKFKTEDLQQAMHDEKAYQKELSEVVLPETPFDFMRGFDSALNLTGEVKVHPLAENQTKIRKSEIRLQKLKNEISDRQAKEKYQEEISGLSSERGGGPVGDFFRAQQEAKEAEEAEGKKPEAGAKPEKKRKDYMGMHVPVWEDDIVFHDDEEPATKKKKKRKRKKKRTAQQRADREMSIGESSGGGNQTVNVGNTTVNINNAGGTVNEKTIRRAIKKATAEQTRELRAAAGGRGRSSI